MARQVAFSEELTICTIGDLSNELLNALQSGKEVVLDLAGVKRIDSAALQVLIAAQAEARELCVTLTCNVSDSIRSYASSIGLEF
jgi:anti-anti-sigma regulatory factor